MENDKKTLDAVDTLLKIADRYQLKQLDWTDGDLSIEIERAEGEGAMAPVVMSGADESDESQLISIESPISGLFYRAGSPEDRPYIDLGDVVVVGQTVALIEAMKVFNEITSEVSGEVVAVCAENGQMVRTGDPLYKLKAVEAGNEE